MTNKNSNTDWTGDVRPSVGHAVRFGGSDAMNDLLPAKEFKPHRQQERRKVVLRYVVDPIKEPYRIPSI